MEFLLICSGIWNTIFAFVKWSLEAQNRLLKILGIVNGAYLIAVGAAGMFLPLNSKCLVLSFCISLLFAGALIDVKFTAERNTFSVLATISSIVIVICAIGLFLFSDTADDIVYACAAATGSIMILSTPFEKLSEKMKKDNSPI